MDAIEYTDNLRDIHFKCKSLIDKNNYEKFNTYLNSFSDKNNINELHTILIFSQGIKNTKNVDQSINRIKKIYNNKYDILMGN